jgi:hypothetical protein
MIMDIINKLQFISFYAFISRGSCEPIVTVLLEPFIEAFLKPNVYIGHIDLIPLLSLYKITS